MAVARAGGQRGILPAAIAGGVTDRGAVPGGHGVGAAPPSIMVFGGPLTPRIQSIPVGDRSLLPSDRRGRRESSARARG